MNLKIGSITSASAAGIGNQALLASLQNGQTGLVKRPFGESAPLSTYIGVVDELEDLVLPTELTAYDCRNNRLAYLAMQQDGFIEAARDLVARHGGRRVGVFVGTSTSGIQQTELAYRQMVAAQGEHLPRWYNYDLTHNNNSAPKLVAEVTGATGMCHAVSTACSSSAKVFANAWRAIKAGFCDAAIVGGVDTLCLTTLFGFNSLQLISDDICRPCDQERTGISIGEAAGFATVEPGDGGVMTLQGFGESSDAYHMSSPHPDGLGAYDSMAGALAMAGLTPDDIDYINLHGTGTKANDLAESRAVCRLFEQRLPCSSTKGWTGHTLGAAGILEAAVSGLVLNHGLLPVSLNTRELDEQIQANVILGENKNIAVRRVLSNSFGFGGSNCSLVMGV
ncbi:beta-ketoacyl-[acyl-carrier-protein] synthase family protein [Teredinibacter turnerae]|uniref:beta-ketoacyl-[acyl-carrier-protein] synthase family protein n=1 Tax=Teredinibacter turnerae TaxID=2426 RepID=UPI000364CEF6|nr:beta-ketoacyl-[acyl-carrier-protein] synthase family protein [Teredinibacter turnerae]